MRLSPDRIVRFTLTIGVVLLTAAPVAQAQSRAIVPIIVNRPVAPPSDTRIVIENPAQVGGFATSGRPANGASQPSSTGEILIQRRPPTVGSPSGVTGPRETRITIEPVPTSTGQSGPRPVQGAVSIPSYSRETRVTVEERGGGAPTTRQETWILSNGRGVLTPIIVAP
jgi:hypothetical protein